MKKYKMVDKEQLKLIKKMRFSDVYYIRSGKYGYRFLFRTSLGNFYAFDDLKKVNAKIAPQKLCVRYGAFNVETLFTRALARKFDNKQYLTGKDVIKLQKQSDNVSKKWEENENVFNLLV